MWSTLLHLRIPFSWFLLPVFLFSLSFSPNINESRLMWVFIILHLLVYPASNGYNSYFDRDEQSIGLLRHPPKVNRSLYFISLLLDGLALILSYIHINTTFALMVLVYGLASKAYSHPSVRLKKYPVSGWITAGFFQGFFTFLTCYIGLNDFEISQALRPQIIAPALLSSIMLWGNYPLTQVYQHQEDAQRGDLTLSLRLGITGTFYFSGWMFLLAGVGFVVLFHYMFSGKYLREFVLAMAPVVLFFAFWFYRVRQHPDYARYDYAMWMNFISSTSLNVFFGYLFLHSTNVLQAFG
ncbi:MAG: UbiA family prenyltransferase [Cyclobacteriaceae bacterium]|nr:UbiA family prenyltransferase [Cyclobacteriaceae bacterium]